MFLVPTRTLSKWGLGAPCFLTKQQLCPLSTTKDEGQGRAQGTQLCTPAAKQKQLCSTRTRPCVLTQQPAITWGPPSQQHQHSWGLFCQLAQWEQHLNSWNMFPVVTVERHRHVGIRKHAPCCPSSIPTAVRPVCSCWPSAAPWHGLQHKSSRAPAGGRCDKSLAEHRTNFKPQKAILKSATGSWQLWKEPPRHSWVFTMLCEGGRGSLGAAARWERSVQQEDVRQAPKLITDPNIVRVYATAVVFLPAGKTLYGYSCKTKLDVTLRF